MTDAVEMQETDDGSGCLVMTYKNRSYRIMEAGPGNTLQSGNVFVMGNSGNRRRPVMLLTMPVGNAFHAVIEGTLEEAYHTLILQPDDFQALKNLGYESVRKRFRVIDGGLTA